MNGPAAGGAAGAAGGVHADELVALARTLLGRADLMAVGAWPRATALLTRQALESALEELWTRRGLEMQRVSARAQLLVLESYMGDEIADDARYAWWALSRACHHHPYELAPTATELQRWADAVDKVIAAVRTTAAPPGSEDQPTS